MATVSMAMLPCQCSYRRSFLLPSRFMGKDSSLSRLISKGSLLLMFASKDLFDARKQLFFKYDARGYVPETLFEEAVATSSTVSIFLTPRLWPEVEVPWLTSKTWMAVSMAKLASSAYPTDMDFSVSRVSLLCRRASASVAQATVRDFS